MSFIISIITKVKFWGITLTNLRKIRGFVTHGASWNLTNLYKYILYEAVFQNHLISRSLGLFARMPSS
jgi:hypothetical protein